MAIGTDYLLDAFIQEGISHLFMVPGGLVDPFLPALGRFPALTMPIGWLVRSRTRRMERVIP